MDITHRRARAVAMVALVAAAAVFLAFHGRIPQDPGYHHFADTRILLGIPNACDVLSNLAFVVAGFLGLLFLASGRGRGLFRDFRDGLAYFVFFAGVLVTGLGSAYYHWAPDTQRLFWDRLPMTIAFTSLFDAVIRERVSERWAARLFVPLLVAGAGSVLYWRWSEQQGRGDLRPYALVQYGLAAAIGLVLLLFPASASTTARAWPGLGSVATAYVLAKLAEALDAPIFRLTRTFSGHTLKHVLAALAALLLLLMLARRPAWEE